ncbi:MAG: hypothetical protein ACJ74Q_26520 [Pyrinomonadaceae bacterium]
MRRFAVVTVLTAVATCFALAARAAASEANGGGSGGGHVDYQRVYRAPVGRTRGTVYALAGTAAVTLLLVVYAVARVRRGRRLS